MWYAANFSFPAAFACEAASEWARDAALWAAEVFALFAEALLQHAVAQGRIDSRRQDAVAHVVFVPFQYQQAGFAIDHTEAFAQRSQFGTVLFRLRVLA